MTCEKKRFKKLYKLNAYCPILAISLTEFITFMTVSFVAYFMITFLSYHYTKEF
jgi:hypothetical protein